MKFGLNLKQRFLNQSLLTAALLLSVNLASADNSEIKALSPSHSEPASMQNLPAALENDQADQAHYSQNCFESLTYADKVFLKGLAANLSSACSGLSLSHSQGRAACTENSRKI